MTNLLSNALKYGAGRPIEISVRAGASRAAVVVRDHGVGIPADEQTAVFGPFARATTAQYHAGLGLGLWIAQQIVQASGGRILRGEPARTKDRRLPWSCRCERAGTTAADDHRRRRRSAKDAALIMSTYGYEVTAFGDARAALGALEGGAAPFLILLDLMMAGMSGWEFRAAQLENP